MDAEIQPGRRTAMRPEMRKRVLLILAALAILLFAFGGLAAFIGRNDTICTDGKVPLRQRDMGLGQTQYWCHNGELVTK